MENQHQTSRSIVAVEQSRSLNAIYGHIVEILTIDDRDYYIPLVVPEETIFPVDTQSEYIPLEENAGSLSSNFGKPRDLIGLRVRVEYYGARWRTGVARIISPRRPAATGNESEVPSRGFRFAVAGGGSV